MSRACGPEEFDSTYPAFIFSKALLPTFDVRLLTSGVRPLSSDLGPPPSALCPEFELSTLNYQLLTPYVRHRWNNRPATRTRGLKEANMTLNGNVYALKRTETGQKGGTSR
jgi:hypothetical protein